MNLRFSAATSETQVQPPVLLTQSCTDRPVTVTMIQKKTDRPEQIRALRRQGLSVSDICESVGVTRQTVWRHCRGLEPAPTPAPSPDGNGHDLAQARDIGLGVLVDRAKNGSVTAAGLLFRQASAEIRADKCVDHISKDEVIAALQAQYGLWRMHLKGAFVRRLLLEFDLDPGQVESLVHDTVSGVTRELNQRFEASEAEGTRE